MIIGAADKLSLRLVVHTHGAGNCIRIICFLCIPIGREIMLWYVVEKRCCTGEKWCCLFPLLTLHDCFANCRGGRHGYYCYSSISKSISIFYNNAEIPPMTPPIAAPTNAPPAGSIASPTSPPSSAAAPIPAASPASPTSAAVVAVVAAVAVAVAGLPGEPCCQDIQQVHVHYS